MNDNRLIAQALLEIAKNSTTEFIEDANIDKEIKAVAEKIGITLPSPDISIFKTTYCEIDKVNLNGVILPRKAVEKGLHTLVGKNCNWEHDGAGFIAGYTIKAEINKDKIETINVLFKSLFPNQIEELKEKVKSGEAAVSFEIWNKDPETGKSVVKELDNGFKEINPIIFHGTGVLLTHQPACPKAKIFKLVANKEINEAEKIVDKVFSEDLIFAQMAIEKPICKNCKTCNCTKNKEEHIVELEKIEEKPAEEAKEKLCPECKKPLKEDEKDLCAECLKKKEESSKEIKTEEKAIETKTEQVAETKVAETKVEEKVEEVKVEEKAQEVETIVPKIMVKTTSIYSEVRIDTYVDGTPSGTQEVKGYNKKITEYKDGTKDEFEEVVEIKKKFDFAEVEEKVNAAKAEKDVEIANLKTEQEKALAEKDKEIKNKTEELGKKDQEIADLKNPKVEPKKEIEMTVGAVLSEKISETKKQAQKINEIIASKHKDKQKA